LLVGGLALVFVALASTVLTMIASDASVVVGLAPVVMLAGLWIIWTAPLRRTLFILIFFCLALDKPGDTEGLWRSPLAPLGGLLLNNINKTVNIPPLTVSLLILLLALLMVVRGYRALYQPWRDGRAGEIVGRPMTWALVAWLSRWNGATRPPGVLGSGWSQTGLPDGSINGLGSPYPRTPRRAPK